MDSNVISDGSMMMDQSAMPMPADVNYDDVAPVPSNEMTPSVPASPAPPTPSGETRLPAIRVPSLPADVESAVPSPSDATMLPRIAPRKVVPRSIAPNTTAARSTEPRSIVSKPIAKTVQPIVPTPVERPAPIRVQPKSAAKPSPKQETKTIVEVKPKRSPSRDSILVEKELTPLPATKVARLPAKITPIVKSANKPLSLETADQSVPVASSRKVKTLTDKLRVRAKAPAKRVVTDTTAAELPSQPKPARLQLGGDNVTIHVVEKVQPKKGLNTAQVVLPKTEATGDSLIRFRNEDLVSKLKKTKPAFTDRITTPKTTKLPSAVKVTPKATPTKSSKETSVVKVKTPEIVTPKRKATLNVSTGGSSTIRFANGKSGVDISRLSAPQGSTVLRFANDKQ